MKKMIRFFWSFDILETEKWLHKMAIKGYQLKKINFVFRIFYFIKSDQSSIYYHINYCRRNANTISNEQVNRGFVYICGNKHYMIITIPNKNEDTLNYCRIISRNRKFQTVAKIILLIYLIPIAILLILVIISIISGTFEATNITEEDDYEPLLYTFMYLSIYFLYIFVFLFSLYLFLKIRKSNNALEIATGLNKMNIPTVLIDKELSRKEESMLKAQGLLITRNKIGWGYSPDITEKWLTTMSESGYNLYRISKTGLTFYFLKNNLEKMKFVIDYQYYVSPDYYYLISDDGWKLVKTFGAFPLSIHLWIKPYINEEPEFYTDFELRVKLTKRLLITYSSTLLGALAIFLIMTIAFIVAKIDYYYIILFFGIVLVECSYFLFKVFSYYLRIRKTML